MKIKSLLKLLATVLLAFPSTALISSLLFDEGGGFSGRFQSSLAILTTAGYTDGSTVPKLLELALAIIGIILCITLFGIGFFLMVKMIMKILPKSEQGPDDRSAEAVKSKDR